MALRRIAFIGNSLPPLRIATFTTDCSRRYRLSCSDLETQHRGDDAITVKPMTIRLRSRYKSRTATSRTTCAPPTS